MRFIFMDEAGTSAKEPVTVVVGLIANADEHVMAAERMVQETLNAVPVRFREGFVFHATDVLQNRDYDKHWMLNDRLRFLKQMMSIPLRVKMAICVSTCWRGGIPDETLCKKLGLSPEQRDHLMAFDVCLRVADRNIRNKAGPNEVAAVVAEDVEGMRKILKYVPRIAKLGHVHLSKEHLRETVKDQEAGHLTQSGDLRIERIRNSVHFVEKAEDPIVQLADACAFGLRRYFANQKFGQEFAASILGDPSHLRAFGPPCGCECYWPLS